MNVDELMSLAADGAGYDELRTAIEEIVKNTSKELEREGYRIIEANESTESLEDGIRANGYLFTVDGSRRATLPTKED